VKLAVLLPYLDERQRRLLMGAEARALGHGGVRAVARAAEVSETTVRKGVFELEAGGLGVEPVLEIVEVIVVGEPCGRARSADVCDTHVALVASRHGDALYTSDLEDMRRLLQACGSRMPVIVRCQSTFTERSAPLDTAS